MILEWLPGSLPSEGFWCHVRLHGRKAVISEKWELDRRSVSKGAVHKVFLKGKSVKFKIMIMLLLLAFI